MDELAGRSTFVGAIEVGDAEIVAVGAGAAGEDAVYYGTKLRGSSNEKAKATFNFRPRRLQGLDR